MLTSSSKWCFSAVARMHGVVATQVERSLEVGVVAQLLEHRLHCRSAVSPCTSTTERGMPTATSAFAATTARAFVRSSPGAGLALSCL